METTTGRPGRPPRLNRDKIVATAIEIVTREGYTKLSMRRLADRLGTSPMGIYYYFESKNELLGFIASEHDSVAAYLQGAPSNDPYERTVQTSEAMVRFLCAHAWALSGILDGHIRVEEFMANHLDGLARSIGELGFDEEGTAETVRGIWRIVVGEAMTRSRAAPTGGLTDTIESYLAGRLVRVRPRRVGREIGSE